MTSLSQKPAASAGPRVGPLHHKHKSIGAKFSESHGWLVPASYGAADQEVVSVASSVGLCDVSSRVKVDVKGPNLDAFIAAIFPDSIPVKPLHAVVLSSTGVSDGLESLSPFTLCRLTRDHAIILSSHTGGPETSSLDAAFASPPDFRGRAYATNVTSVLAGLTVAGPKSDLVLRKLTGFDLSVSRLPNLACVEGGFAKIHTLIVRSDSGAGLRAYGLYFGREYAEYVWDAVMNAGKDVAIKPFGHEAFGKVFGESEGP